MESHCIFDQSAWAPSETSRSRCLVSLRARPSGDHLLRAHANRPKMMDEEEESEKKEHGECVEPQMQFSRRDPPNVMDCFRDLS